MLKLALAAGLTLSIFCGLMTLRSSGLTQLFAGGNTKSPPPFISGIKGALGLSGSGSGNSLFPASSSASGGGGYLPPKSPQNSSNEGGTTETVFRIVILSTTPPPSSNVTPPTVPPMVMEEVSTDKTTVATPNLSTSSEAPFLPNSPNRANLDSSGGGGMIDAPASTGGTAATTTPEKMNVPSPELRLPTTQPTGYTYINRMITSTEISPDNVTKPANALEPPNDVYLPPNKLYLPPSQS